MAPTIKSLLSFLKKTKKDSITPEQLQFMRDLNKDYFDKKGRIGAPLRKIKLPIGNGTSTREYGTDSNIALSYLIAEYNRKPRAFIKETAKEALGNKIKGDKEKNVELRLLFEDSFTGRLPEVPFVMSEEIETVETVSPIEEEKLEPIIEELEEIETIQVQVIDEPRPEFDISGLTEIDFSGETEEAKVEQIKKVFNFVSDLTGVPVNIQESTRQGLDVISSGIKEKKSSKSVFQKIKGFAKSVLGFISIAPLPIPPQIKAGAAGLLVGIEAVEGIASLVEGSSEGTDAIRAGIELVSNIEELKPVTDVASGIVNTVEGILAVRDTVIEEQQNKGAVDSIPINNTLIDNGLEQTLRENQIKIDDNGGVLNKSSIQIETPIQIGDENITIDNAKQLSAEKDNPEEEVQQEEVQSEEDSSGNVLQGQSSSPEAYIQAVHPDALGIYFGSSTFPKWNTSLLKDREQRFASLTPEAIKSFLLQQNKMIQSKYDVDLFIPKLIYDESSDALDIQRENFEIVQLFSKLKGINKGSSDVVGIKLKDLANFRQMLSGSTSSESNPLSPTQPIEPIETQGTDISTPQPESIQQEDEYKHPKDTTKNFVYSPSGIRISDVITDKQARRASVPSLSEMVTLEGHNQLQTRSNLTRGYSHGGPQVRGIQQNQIRRSITGTSEINPKSSQVIYKDINNVSSKIRM